MVPGEGGSSDDDAGGVQRPVLDALLWSTSQQDLMAVGAREELKGVAPD